MAAHEPAAPTPPTPPTPPAASDAPIRGQRIVVVGNSGSGKSTMAGHLAARLGAPHIELDALHWDPNWTEAPWDVFRERLAPALAAQRWVVDGNYSRVRDLTWGRADTLVWLDYPLPLILARLTRRTIRRVVRREPLWNGNRERLWVQFTRDSLIVWALTTHARRKREILASLADPAYAHLTAVRLRSPRQAANWLSTVAPALAPMARVESAPPPPR